MKNMFLPTILISLMLSCTSKETTQEKTDTLTEKSANAKMKNFDLSTINFSENINTILSDQNLKLETGKSNEQTILGYETYAAAASGLLKFNGESLNGKSVSGENEVIFHYASGSKTIGMYELKIYTEKEASNLLDGLNSLLGKPQFEKNDNQTGSVELDENGDEVKSADQSRKLYRVWENSGTGLSYFLVQTNDGKRTYTELTALNRKEKSAKDWITFRAFDWYKNK